MGLCAEFQELLKRQGFAAGARGSGLETGVGENSTGDALYGRCPRKCSRPSAAGHSARIVTACARHAIAANGLDPNIKPQAQSLKHRFRQSVRDIDNGALAVCRQPSRNVEMWTHGDSADALRETAARGLVACMG